MLKELMETMKGKEKKEWKSRCAAIIDALGPLMENAKNADDRHSLFYDVYMLSVMATATFYAHSEVGSLTDESRLILVDEAITCWDRFADKIEEEVSKQKAPV